MTPAFLILKNHPLVSLSRFTLSRYCFSTSSETVTSEFLINRHHFSPEAAKRVSSIYPYLEKPQKTDSVLSYLRQLGLTNTQLVRVVTCWPRIVASTPENIESKVKILHDYDFSDSDIVDIILNDPCIICYSFDRISSSLSVLKRLLGSNERLSYLLRKQKRLFCCDYEKRLLPNIRILNDCGVPMEQINALMYTFPQFFLRVKPDDMTKHVDKTAKMGVDRDSGMFIHAVRSVSGMTDETCLLKLKFFRDLGFTEDDMVRMLRRSPGALSVSQTKIEKIKELLLETGKYDMSCIINWPSSLMSSVEKRYKPRLQILKHLEKRGLIDKWPSLASLCVMTDNAFFKRFVALDPNSSDDRETENHP